MKNIIKLFNKKVYLGIILLFLFLFGGCVLYYFKNGFNKNIKYNWYIMGVYGKDGFDLEGYVVNGFN